MSPKQKSKFNDWFVEQHGSRCRLFLDQHDIDLANIAARGDAARDELCRRQGWDMRKESALYAWQVKHGK